MHRRRRHACGLPQRRQVASAAATAASSRRARRPGASSPVPPFEDVGVPPTVIAMYCLPPTRVDRRAGRDLEAGLERPQHLARARVERAQHAVAAAGEAEAARGRRHAAALGLGRLELPDAPARVDVDRADRAVVRASPAAGVPNSPFASPRKTSPTSLRCFCVGVSFVLDQHAGRLGGRVDDVGSSPGRTRRASSSARRSPPGRPRPAVPASATDARRGRCTLTRW